MYGVIKENLGNIGLLNSLLIFQLIWVHIHVNEHDSVSMRLYVLIWAPVSICVDPESSCYLILLALMDTHGTDATIVVLHTGRSYVLFYRLFPFNWSSRFNILYLFTNQLEVSVWCFVLTKNSVNLSACFLSLYYMRSLIDFSFEK